MRGVGDRSIFKEHGVEGRAWRRPGVVSAAEGWEMPASLVLRVGLGGQQVAGGLDRCGGRGARAPLPPRLTGGGCAYAGQGFEVRMLRKSLKRKEGPRAVVLLANCG